MQKEERKKEASKANNKAKQHSKPKAVTLPKKNELARQTCTCTHVQTIGLPVGVCMADMYMYTCVGLLVGNLAFITHKVMPFSRAVLGTSIYICMHM